MEKTNDNFIMLPTVDFCFKELMNNEKVRRGFIAALLRTDPEKIRKTTLLPTELRREYADDKLGILDVRVLLENGTQIDMEMQVAYFENWDARAVFYLSKIFSDQLKKGEPYENLKQCIHVSILDFIHFKNDDECCRKISFCDEVTGEKYTDLMQIQVLELKKLAAKSEHEENIISWMRFLSGKSREEFEVMAKSDEYMEEAYDALKKLSADDRAKLEYEAREKAIRDYNSQMSSALRRGRKRGIVEGQLLNRIELIQKKCRKGKSLEQTADEMEEEVADIEKLYLLVKENPEMPAEQFLQNFEETLLPADRNK